jgi:hypothetical protein
MESVFEKVPPHFSGVDEAGFKMMFQSISDRVQSHVGELYVQNRFYDEATLSHKQLINWVGGYALHTVNDTSYRYWSESDNSHDASPWGQCVWKIINVYAIGFALANHSFKYNRNASWNPICEPVQMAPTLSVSNRRLSGSNIAQALFHRLFPEYFDTDNPMMTFAIVDMFATSPNKDNPLYVAFRRAVKGSLLSYPYPIPYFWRTAIDYLLLSSPADTALYQRKYQNMLVVDDFAPQDHPFENVQDKTQEAVQSSDAPYVPFEAQVSTKETSGPNIKPVEIAGVTPVFKSEYSIAERVACDGEKYQKAFDAPSDPANSDMIKTFLNRLSEQVKKRVISGDFRVNGRGAFAHRVDNHFYLTYPIAVDRMFDLLPDMGIVQSISEQSFKDFLVQTGAIKIANAQIKTSKGDTIDIQLAQLHFQLVKLCFLDPDSQPNNPDIHIEI